MSCNNVCRICPRFIISTAVNFEAATNSLLIQLPAGSYRRCEKYCLVINQEIPAATTRNALVYVTIGTGAERYPLVRNNCLQVTACSVKSNWKYSTTVVTDSVNGVFKLLGNVCGDSVDPIASLPITAVAPASTSAALSASLQTVAATPVAPNTTSVTRTATTTTVSNKTEVQK